MKTCEIQLIDLYYILYFYHVNGIFAQSQMATFLWTQNELLLNVAVEGILVNQIWATLLVHIKFAE